MLTLAKIVLGPLLLWQGKRLRKTALRLPEPAGPRHGKEWPPASMHLQAQAAPPLNLLVVGDSSAAGVGVETQAQAFAQPLARELAARRGRRVHWQLVAKSGVNSQEALALLEQADIRQADVMAVALGVNDVTSQVPAKRYVAHLAELAARMQAQSDVSQIVFSGLPPLHTLPIAPQPLRWYLGQCARRLDLALRDWIKRDASRHYCTLQWALPHEMAIDQFHPGPTQYVQWAQMTAELLDAALAQQQP